MRHENERASCLSSVAQSRWWHAAHQVNERMQCALGEPLLALYHSKWDRCMVDVHTHAKPLKLLELI